MSTLYSFQNNMRMIERKTFIIGAQKNDVIVTFHTKRHVTYLWQPFTIVVISEMFKNPYTGFERKVFQTSIPVSV